MTLRSAFISTVSRLLDEDDKVVLLLGDISVYGFREAFARHPTRCYNVGICEQASVGLAAGLAMSGLYPIYHTISAFLVRRAYEQLRLDFGEQKLPGLFVGIGGAYEYEKLGPTHCAPDHMMLMGVIPGMNCVDPGGLPGPMVSPEHRVEHWIGKATRERALVYMSLEERK